MTIEKNILEIVRENSRTLDKSFPTEFKTPETENIYDNINNMIVTVSIQMLSDIDLLPVTKRVQNKIFKKKSVIR